MRSLRRRDRSDGRLLESVTGEIQYFQRIGESEDRLREALQVGREIEAADSGQFTTFQLFQCVHAACAFLAQMCGMGGVGIALGQ